MTKIRTIKLRWIIILCLTISTGCYSEELTENESLLYQSLGLTPPAPEVRELDQLALEVTAGARQYLFSSNTKGRCQINLKLIKEKYQGEMISGNKQACEKVKFYFDHYEVPEKVKKNPNMQNIIVIIDEMKESEHIK